MKIKPAVFVLCMFLLTIFQIPSINASTSRPDLVVTDVWKEEGSICYQIRNIGDDAAAEGHYTFLFIDGANITSDWVYATLEPGERWGGCFDYDWVCTRREDQVVVFADYLDAVAENNETNNVREELWKCDTTPPEIISGPSVHRLTQTSAVILWETDEESDSVVKYGETARYNYEEADSTLVRDHNIPLTGLNSSTTYHFVVQSTDVSGNTVESKDVTFETLPLLDEVDPVVAVIDPGECMGTVTVSAEASDNTEVEKVEFYLDDELLFIAYSPPYKFLFKTAKYENGEYTLKAEAFDVAGRHSVDESTIGIANLIDETVPTVQIMSLNEGASVSGEITVWAYLWDDTGLEAGFLTVDGVAKDYTGGADPRWLPPTQHPTFASVTFNWDTSEVPNGYYTIGVVALDVEGKTGWDTRGVFVENEVPAPLPKLVITDRSVTRYQNAFTIVLEVKNVGAGEATAIEISDDLEGFQPILRRSSFADYVPEFRTVKHGKTTSLYGRGCSIICKMNIPPGETRIFTYNAVPVLVWPKSASWTPKIGHSTFLGCKSLDGTELHSIVQKQVYQTKGVIETIPQAYKNALAVSDYLIITNPSRLLAQGGPRKDVEALLATMGRLAYDKLGVLGYLYWADAWTIRNLLKKGGEWSSQMKSDWTSNGYLLIVGETEIIPAWATKHSCTGMDTVHVPTTDIIYADTVGDWICPELNVGRIIGNTPKDLIIPINTSICVHEGVPGYNFDMSDALVVSGGGKGVSAFEKNVDEVAGLLELAGFKFKKLKLTEVEDAGKNMLTEFKANVKDKDVIFFRDHGWEYIWSDVIHTNDFPISFGNTKPFVFACCCGAGRYAGIKGIAEVFLSNGTAVYIGATEASKRSANNDAAYAFFLLWPGSPKCVDGSLDCTIGATLKRLKRWLAKPCSFVTEFKRGIWVAEYQLYGDPKYGEPGGSILAPTKTNILGDLSSLDVVIPDYIVTSIEGEDYVQIPGGDVLLDTDKPLIPFYTVSLDYPKGYKIQNIILSDRSGLVTDTGLNIPNVVDEWDLVGGNSFTSEEEGWWPEDVFTWTVFENPDGTTTLFIVMYPFCYNFLTTDVRFYKDYSFDITYTVSPVEITSLMTDKDAYEQGDTVMVSMRLNNSGEAQDVIVSALIRQYGSGEIVDGLFLSTLHGLRGEASFSPQWDSNGFDPDYYYVEVTLKDTDGNVLDKKAEMFGLGISSGEITSFTATPEHFDIGDDIEIDMSFMNNGTVNITGVAITRIVNSTGHLVEEFRHNVTHLTPSESVGFSDAWDTSEAEKGSYNIMSYVLYDSKASDTATATVQTFDREPPYIGMTSQEPEVPDDDEEVTITVDVTNGESGVRNVTLSYSTDGGESWNNVTMERTTGDTYEGEIPGLPAGTNIQYRIIAYDNAGNPAVEDNAGEYYTYTVIPEFPTWASMLIILIVLTVAIAIYKRRLLKTPIR